MRTKGKNTISKATENNEHRFLKNNTDKSLNRKQHKTNRNNKPETGCGTDMITRAMCLTEEIMCHAKNQETISLLPEVEK